MSGVSRARSRRNVLRSRLYSPEKRASGISRRRASRSSSETRMRRPLPSPSQGSEVREGQAITMLSPSPFWFFSILRSRPSPKATSRATETVPHVMPSSVSNVRSFWWRTSWSICRRKESDVTAPSLDLLRGPLDDELLFGQALGHLDAHAVGEAGLDLLLDRRIPLALSGQLDARPAVREGDEPLRQHEHVVLLTHRDLGVRRVAGAQHHVLRG